MRVNLKARTGPSGAEGVPNSLMLPEEGTLHVYGTAWHGKKNNIFGVEEEQRKVETERAAKSAKLCLLWLLIGKVAECQPVACGINEPGCSIYL